MVETETRLLLLRHGEVASHRGDVPVTDAGLDHAERTGKAVGAEATGALTVLYGGTRRTRETAEALIRGIDDAARVQGPHDSFALRNPDMYLAGTRVNMVSSAEALAEQVPGMTEEQVRRTPGGPPSSPRPTGSAGGWARNSRPGSRRPTSLAGSCASRRASPTPGPPRAGS